MPNPAAEVDHSELDEDPSGEAEAEKVLTFYELDLGLNNVVRKWVDPIDNNANLLVPVAGGGDGPGGVIVCAENMVYWKNQVWGKGGRVCARGGAHLEWLESCLQGDPGSILPRKIGFARQNLPERPSRFPSV